MNDHITSVEKLQRFSPQNTFWRDAGLIVGFAAFLFLLVNWSL